jgi:ribosome-binding protein aMBF1 (putative translation factor)
MQPTWKYWILARAAVFTIEAIAMNKPHIFRTPGGEELVVMARQEYEELQDVAVAATRARDLAEGREELLASEEVDALLNAPTPLVFWRKKRGLTQTALAADIGVSQNFLSDMERGKAIGDVVLYAKLARRLGVSIEDLVPEEAEQIR